MDKISKSLKKLNKKELIQIKSVLNLLLSNEFNGLDIKKIRGRKDIFRARKGGFRIIYRFDNGNIYILAIERRNEKTYSGL